MVGMTLLEIRNHIESLAGETGEYYVVCGRTGDRPVPVSGNRFRNRTTARSAALAAEQYRSELRRYDPRVPYYDLIVCQEAGPMPHAECPQRSREPGTRTLSEPVLDTATPGPERRRLVEFSHRVAAAIFETLSDTGYDAVESAVMEMYFDLAETLPDPDDLCLCLLESIARELDDGASPAEQAEIIAEAASRLPPTETTARPVSTTLSALEELGLLGSYTRSPWSIDLDDGTRSIGIRLSEYALSPTHDRLPVLPIVLELHRRQPDCPPASLEVVDVDDGWRLTLVQARETEPAGLAAAPIQPEV